jgi:serine protease Do
MIKKCFLQIILITLCCSSTTYASELKGFADIVEPLIPAVVNVYTAKYSKPMSSERRFLPKGLPGGIQEFFEGFEPPYGLEDMYSNPKAISLGSGFIIDSHGYIVTNHHVVEAADEIYVKLGTNEELQATLIGSDQRTDLALLKVEAKYPLPFVKFGNSDQARVGDWVIAIGNPFGLGGTVTTGIISSKARDITDGFVDDFIQTDTAINSGNSGGPMFNLNGAVIGVNTSIFSPSGTNIGIGFAIPSSTVKSIIEQLKSTGKVIRGMLNIKIQEVTAEIAEGLGLKSPSGVLVYEVEPGGAADKSGIKSGDLIVEFNGVPIKNTRKLQIAVSEAVVGSEVNIIIMRSGVKQELKCLITEQDKQNIVSLKKMPQNIKIPDGSIEKYGIIFSNLSVELANALSISSSSGVVITGFKNNRGNFFELMIGDLVLEVNQKAVKTLGDLSKIYDEAKLMKRQHVVLLVKRTNMKVFVALPLQ